MGEEMKPTDEAKRLREQKRHGCSRSYGYSRWWNMIKRCTDTNHPHYHNYGGRGITVCEEWMDVRVFINWLEDNGHNGSLHIDRIDNNKGYSPENCRLTTQAENNRNKRKYRNCKSGYTGVYLFRNGKWMAQLWFDGINIHIGYFTNKIDAAVRRDSYIINKGINAPLNFPVEGICDINRITN